MPPDVCDDRAIVACAVGATVCYAQCMDARDEQSATDTLSPGMRNPTMRLCRNVVVKKYENQLASDLGQHRSDEKVRLKNKGKLRK